MQSENASMKKSMATILTRLFKEAAIAFLFLNPVLFSCTKDDPNNGEDTLTNDGSTGDGALFVYIDGKTFNSRQAYSALVSLISSRDYNQGWN